MADKLQISQAAYNRLENGTVEKAKPELYFTIAEILEVDISFLFSPDSGPSFYNCNNQWGDIGVIHKHGSDATDFLKIIAAQMEALQQQIALLNKLLQNGEKGGKS